MGFLLPKSLLILEPSPRWPPRSASRLPSPLADNLRSSLLGGGKLRSQGYMLSEDLSQVPQSPFPTSDPSREQVADLQKAHQLSQRTVSSLRMDVILIIL